MKQFMKIFILVVIAQLVTSCGETETTMLDQSTLNWESKTYFNENSINGGENRFQLTIITRNETSVYFQWDRNKVKLFENYNFIKGAKFTTDVNGEPFKFVIERWEGTVPETGERVPFYLTGLSTNLITFEASLSMGSLILTGSDYIRNVRLKDDGTLGIRKGIDEAYNLVKNL